MSWILRNYVNFKVRKGNFHIYISCDKTGLNFWRYQGNF